MAKFKIIRSYYNDDERKIAEQFEELYKEGYVLQCATTLPDSTSMYSCIEYVFVKTEE